jgi:hypothetical protein
MNLIGELQELEQRFKNGKISSEEFSYYKAKLWKKAGLNIPNSSTEDFIQQASNEKLELLAQLDRDWKKEKQKFMVKDRHGNKLLASKIRAIFYTICSIFVLGMSILSFVIPRATLNFERFNIIRFLYLVFMFPASILGLWEGFKEYQKVNQYRSAFTKYQTKRDQILSS